MSTRLSHQDSPLRAEGRIAARRSLKTVIGLAGLSALSFAAAVSAAPLSADLINADGEIIGGVTLTQTDDGLLVEAEASGLPPGSRAMHFHEKAECDPDDGFESAGDHHNPLDRKHGAVDGGPHAGDLPNQIVGSDGMLRMELTVTRLSLRDGDTALLDKDGSALVIHADADDYESQPAGDAGDRIACAEIKE